MSLRRLALQPGIDTTKTKTLNSTGFSTSQLIRWLNKQPQKYSGWAHMNDEPFVGTCRGLFGWADYLGNPYLAVGTEQRVYLLIGGALYDITPIDATSNVAVDFSTTSGSAVVTIEDAANSPSVGDWINIVTPVSVGGIVLEGYYQVTGAVSGTEYEITAADLATSTVPNAGAVPLFNTAMASATILVTLANHGLTNADTFTVGVSTTVATIVISGDYAVSVLTANTFNITGATLAGSTTSGSENGGLVRIQYLLPSGYAVNTALTGYGIGDYGAGDYGLSSAAQLIAPLRQWAFDQWGEDLVANYTGGSIYYWAPADPTIPLAIIATAPTMNNGIFVFSQAQILVALGSEVLGTQYPMLLRWSDVADFTEWTAAPANQAGSFQLSKGSRIVGARASGLGALVWTDTTLYSMFYSGTPGIFAINEAGGNCGLLAARAVASVSAGIFWAGTDSFYIYAGGGVQPIDCPVWDFFHGNLDQSQLGQVFTALDSTYHEVALYFPTADGTMAFVKWNFVDNLWDYGWLERTAWIDHSPMGAPIGTDTSGLIQQHDTGYDADGAAMSVSIGTGDLDQADGEQYWFMDRVIPDFYWLAGTPTVSLTIYGQDYPEEDEVAYGPFLFMPGVEFVNPGIRARQFRFVFSSNDLGSLWRIGAIRLDVRPDGKA